MRQLIAAVDRKGRGVWRIEQDGAVLVARERYRGPDGERPRLDGVLPRQDY